MIEFIVDNIELLTKVDYDQIVNWRGHIYKVQGLQVIKQLLITFENRDYNNNIEQLTELLCKQLQARKRLRVVAPRTSMAFGDRGQPLVPVRISKDGQSYTYIDDYAIVTVDRDESNPDLFIFNTHKMINSFASLFTEKADLRDFSNCENLYHSIVRIAQEQNIHRNTMIAVWTTFYK